MLAPEPHDEPGNHWIVITPNAEFLGKRLGVGFVDGEGRTTDPDKAREFDLIYGYEVVPFVDAPTWVGIEESRPETGKAWTPEPSIAAVVGTHRKSTAA